MSASHTVSMRDVLYKSKLGISFSNADLALDKVTSTSEDWITIKIGTLVQIEGQLTAPNPSGTGAPVLTLPYHAVTPANIVGTIILDDNEVLTATSLATVASATASSVTFTDTLLAGARNGGAVRVVYETSG